MVRAGSVILFTAVPHSPASCSETSDSSSTANTTKRKRNTWSTAEEQILINLCREYKSGLKGSGSSQKWQQIADEVNRASDEITASSLLKTGTRPCMAGFLLISPNHRWSLGYTAQTLGREHSDVYAKLASWLKELP